MNLPKRNKIDNTKNLKISKYTKIDYKKIH